MDVLSVNISVKKHAQIVRKEFVMNVILKDGILKTINVLQNVEMDM